MHTVPESERIGVRDTSYPAVPKRKEEAGAMRLGRSGAALGQPPRRNLLTVDLISTDSWCLYYAQIWKGFQVSSLLWEPPHRYNTSKMVFVELHGRIRWPLGTRRRHSVDNGEKET